MDTFLEMQTELTERLMVAASSTLFPLDRIKTLLKNSYTWAKQLYSWNELERGRDTPSQIGYEYYDYPADFRTDTLGEFLFFNGEVYKKKDFKDYRRHKLNYPNSTKKIFADYGRQYFISPTPTVVATIELWGQVEGAQLSADGDKTIFSQHDITGNEAVIERAFGVAMKRIDDKASKEAIAEGVRLLTVIWKKQEERQQTAQPLDKPMFNVPNFFPTKSTFTPGNFDGLGGEE